MFETIVEIAYYGAVGATAFLIFIGAASILAYIIENMGDILMHLLGCGVLILLGWVLTQYFSWL